MRATAHGGQERPFQVQAGHDLVVDKVGQDRDLPQQVRQRRGDEAGQQRGGAVAPMEPSDGRAFLRGAGGEAAAPTTVDVDEAWDDQSAADRAVLTDRGIAAAGLGEPFAVTSDPATIDHLVALDQPCVRQDRQGPPPTWGVPVRPSTSQARRAAPRKPASSCRVAGSSRGRRTTPRWRSRA